MKRIVLVDDDALMREVLRRGLEREGFTVTAHDSAAEALEEISSRTPGLVVTDVKMPGMDGVALLREIRNRHLAVPVVLVTADPTDAVRQSAVELGARVLKKPVGGVERLSSEIARAWEPPGVLDEALRVDTLRLDLITDLSHQLRTPLTAMRLALDGLFSQLEEVMSQPQRRLADISRRNVDRVIGLVENQMTLLQMVLGEVPVSRQLVDVTRLASDVTDALFGDQTDTLRVDNSGSALVFTDAARVSALLRTLLSGGPPGADRVVAIKPRDHAVEIDIALHLLPGERDIPSRDPADPGSLRVVDPPGKTDFEQRAYGAIVDELGGEFVLVKDNDRKHARIVLPVKPAFDRRYDFANPLRGVRRHAENGGTSASIIKLLFDGAADRDGAKEIPSLLADCLTRCPADEPILRGREPHSYYLVTSGRSRDEVNQIRDALDEELAGVPCRVHRPQTLVEDAQDVSRIVSSIDGLT